MGSVTAPILAVILSLSGVSGARAEDDRWKLYDDSEVAVIEVTVDPAALDYMWAHPESDSEHVATIHFTNALIDETVDHVGFRLRGNTFSRNSLKKSFKIAFNAFEKGRKFHGVEKLNLNGEHNDPSIVRSKLCWDFFRQMGVSASAAAHAALYINGSYYGLYISVEHIDEEFLENRFENDGGNLWKCVSPADLRYLGDDPDLYKLVVDGRRIYELKTNEEADDYSDLARFIDRLNNTPDDSIADTLRVLTNFPAILKYFVLNQYVGSWDDYWFLRNNYYLYHDPVEDRFHWIPYDYDNTFGVDWFDVDWSTVSPYDFAYYEETMGWDREPRPLIDRILATPELRDLYTHFLEFYGDAVFDPARWSGRLEAIHAMITPFAEPDSFRTLDWGFTVEDFHRSFGMHHYENQHVRWGLLEFADRRRSFIADALEYIGSPPQVYALRWSPRTPEEGSDLEVTASAFSPYGLADVVVEYFVDDTTATATLPMEFDPVPGTTLIEEADRWVARLPLWEAGRDGGFRIRVTDDQGATRYFPRGRWVDITPVPVGIMDDPLPAAGSLRVAVLPNPINPRTRIRIDSSTPARWIRLEVFDARGRRLWTTVQKASGPGTYVIPWDGRDTQRRPVPSGVYVARVTTNEDSATRRLTVLK